MKNIKIAKEYLASPIFCPDIDTMGHLEIEDLPISESLKIDLMAWDAEYQATFNDEYPPDSGFDTSDAEKDHISRGAALAERLRMELGDIYFIQYEP